MTPEHVLNLKNEDNAYDKLNEWLNSYRLASVKYPLLNKKANELSCRAEKAYELYVQRNKSDFHDSHDDMYYIEQARIIDSENEELDGNFPLGNERDARFASEFFSTDNLVKIQLGLFDEVECGYYTEYCDDVLVKKGFIAEMQGDFETALKCYGGVSLSKAVQDREFECLNRIKKSECEKLTERINDGDTDALWQMALLCKKENKMTECESWFNKALERGQPDALLSAAEVYLDKSGGFYNKKEGIDYLKRAAENSSVQALIMLGDIEAEGSDMSFWQCAAKLRNLDNPLKSVKKKITKQHKKQMEYYISAAELGDTNAMNAVSMAYHLGYPIERDDERAFLYASRSADLSDPAGLYQTAYYYENGFGTEPDIPAAILLYTQSAQSGVIASAMRLYQIYSDGLYDIKPDKDKADYYMSVICEQESGEHETDC